MLTASSICSLTRLAMFCSTFFLGLILVISAQGMEVVARVHFSQPSYVVMEQEGRICVDVINDLGPTSSDFFVSFYFSTSLMGVDPDFAEIRSDIFLFPANTDRSQACFNHIDDSIPCEASINGTITLDDNNQVEVVEPSSAIVTIQDDDYVSAQFENNFYSLMEGDSSNALYPVITASSGPIGLLIRQVSHMDERILAISPAQILLNEGSNRVDLSIPDDEIALQDHRAFVLQLSVPSGSVCGVQMPINRTTVFLMDDDSVTVELTSSAATVTEGDNHWICVRLSRPIAREITLTLDLQPLTASSDDFETSSMTVTFSRNSQSPECVSVAITQDNVIEDDEAFEVTLSLQTILPASIQNNLIIGRSSATITIQDTSTCTAVNLDPSKPNSQIYVYDGRALCFSCNSCVQNLFWNLTSYQGQSWSGRTGETLQSTSNPIYIGRIAANGSLLLINSSFVFSKSQQGTLRFSEEIPEIDSSYVYDIIAGEEARVTELNVIERNDSFQFVCLYSGLPEPQLNWDIDSKPATGIAAQQTESGFQSTLTVHRTVAEKSVFTCTASNPLGTDSLQRTIVDNDPTAHHSANSAGTVCVYLSLCLISAAFSHLL